MKWIVGVDEVGRGPLAGPVYVCAFAMPESTYKKMQWVKESVLLTDSKLMPAKRREFWNKELQKMKNDGVARIAIATAPATQIDKKGITVCIRECVAQSLENLAIHPKGCTVLLDGSLKAPALYKKQQTVIKGDRIHKVIAAASVVAKVARDAYMSTQHQKYPLYGWDANKGYGTKTHQKSLISLGLTPLHRKSFLTKYLTK